MGPTFTEWFANFKKYFQDLLCENLQRQHPLCHFAGGVQHGQGGVGDHDTLQHHLRDLEHFEGQTRDVQIENYWLALVQSNHDSHIASVLINIRFSLEMYHHLQIPVTVRPPYFLYPVS